MPFASLPQIKTRLVRNVVENLCAIDFVYVKMKSKESRSAPFTTGLNAALIESHYPLPKLEQVFAKLNGGLQLRIFKCCEGRMF